MSNRIDIVPCSTKDTLVDLTIDITCHEYSTVHEVLAKIIGSLEENKTAVEPGKYRVLLTANIINKML